MTTSARKGKKARITGHDAIIEGHIFGQGRNGATSKGGRMHIMRGCRYALCITRMVKLDC